MTQEQIMPAISSLRLHSFGGSVDIDAHPSGLTIQSRDANHRLRNRDEWPTEALSTPEGLRVALQIEQSFEMGLAEEVNAGACFLYDNFLELHKLNFDLTRLWT